MQLLTEARERLPPEACTLQGQHHSTTASSLSSSSSSSSSGGSQEQQRQAWQLCVSQVQQDVLLVLQLTQQWKQEVSTGSCFLMWLLAQM
jgi:hypothetical protein